ncbi:uncharacterized protein LOC142984798 [Anticarsia gemmatalis]|uniref:uncharacterized protein LOC142984798 n=1 Tax=Anticarsia gemmatalis TaxID=129554 RepID=UPI003F777420
MEDKYTSISKERFNQLKANYSEFLERLTVPDKEPVRVFGPLPKQAVEDIYLIREVSADLQNKKNEDMKKAAQAAQDEEEKAKAAAKEENQETPETETQN